MKVAVVGIEKSALEREVSRRGFSLDKLKPDIVISYGGDGSALIAEQLYPGIPRLAIKHSRTCEKCSVGGLHNFSSILLALSEKKYKISKATKLEGVVNGDRRKMLVGLNEINVAHAVPIRAVRFDVHVDGNKIAEDLIGDGLITATTYGSTAYFKSITGRSFSSGIGLAFNNVNKNIKFKLVPEGSEVKVKVNRGPALMCADNNTTMIPLKDGDVVTIRKSKDVAHLIEIDGEGKISI